MKITAKLIKTNRSQNSCRISPSERKLTLALEEKTGSQMLPEMILQKLKHLVGRWKLRVNFLFSSYVFCYYYYFIPPFRIWANFPPFRLLGFAAISRHSVFLGFKIFRPSVFQDLGLFSAVPPFRRSSFQGRPTWVYYNKTLINTYFL